MDSQEAKNGLITNEFQLHVEIAKTGYEISSKAAREIVKAKGAQLIDGVLHYSSEAVRILVKRGVRKL